MNKSIIKVLIYGLVFVIVLYLVNYVLRYLKKPSFNLALGEDPKVEYKTINGVEMIRLKGSEDWENRYPD